ncbi:MAG: ornithine carbamoyltransferase [Clostridiales bacterium]|nr:ornithine carbamoyltransferase [Clostridiales bacterium]
MNLNKYKAKSKFKQKHLLKLEDYSEDDILQVLSLALKLKKHQKDDTNQKVLKDKTLGMIFLKSSTRTRVSFEAGMVQLGGYPLFLSSNDIQMGRGEPIEDTVKVLSRYIDGIMIRTFKQSDVEDLAHYGSIPIINGLTDKFHPCQVLADLLTIYEYKKTFKGLKLAYIGDGYNMANSLIVGCAKLGINIAVASPVGYTPDETIINKAKKDAIKNNCTILITSDPKFAIANADIVYSDVFSSMGQEDENQQRLRDFKGFQVNSDLFSLAKNDAIFMHCLPAHRGEEVTADVIDGPQSVIYDEAENRLHAQNAVMALLMG